MSDANVSKACRLVGFDHASIHPLPMPIFPEEFAVDVGGTVSSLGVTVSLVYRGTLVDNADAWLEYEVVGCGAWDAIGERHYTATTSLQKVEGTTGVQVVGAGGHVQTLPWPA